MSFFTFEFLSSCHLGTYLCSNDEAAQSVEHALSCGYRHIDTAEFYANHEVPVPNLVASCWMMHFEYSPSSVPQHCTPEEIDLSHLSNLTSMHQGVARGIAASSVKREDIFITDKVGPGGIFGNPPKDYDATMHSLKSHLEKLKVDYVDLYLIHHNCGTAELRLEQ